MQSITLTASRLHDGSVIARLELRAHQPDGHAVIRYDRDAGAWAGRAYRQAPG
jgi:hypothetical protein